ncbi:hypothetical protein [Actinomadura rupiterrae]|uniref:hypothetical protein n=1 Tax=Actinomadura rupiterrae TaxID=559627 RepID=UPI0020A41653|nr:hypothetical protein [Actinomadura rupiterrae]MCP2343687.1 hypothetical protein [Actinomadura rupiterrae]
MPSQPQPDDAARVAALAEQFKRTGEVRCRCQDAEERERLRAEARRAARQLGRPVRTYATDSVVLAVLTDWPANALESRLTESRARNAMDRAFRNEP